MSDVAASERTLGLAGARNARDVGGVATADGRRVRSGLVFRADALAALSEADVARLAGLGLVAEIDFRSDYELDRNGRNKIPDGVRQLHLPVVDESGSFLASVLTDVIVAGDPAALAEMLGDGKAARIATDGVRVMATQASARAAFAQALTTIAESVPGAVMYNCTSGKDRTGWMTALLLGILGASDEVIVADYLASNEHLRAGHERLYAALVQRGVDAELIRPLTEQHAEEIEAALADMRAGYGDFDGYARDGLGLDAAVVSRLRAGLLEP